MNYPSKRNQQLFEFFEVKWLLLSLECGGFDQSNVTAV